MQISTVFFICSALTLVCFAMQRSISSRVVVVKKTGSGEETGLPKAIVGDSQH